MSPAARPSKTAKKENLKDDLSASTTSPKKTAAAAKKPSAPAATKKTTAPKSQAAEKKAPAKAVTKAPAKAASQAPEKASAAPRAAQKAPAALKTATPKNAAPQVAASQTAAPKTSPRATVAPSSKTSSTGKTPVTAKASAPVASGNSGRAPEYVLPPPATGEGALTPPLRYAPLVSSSVVLDFLENSGNHVPTQTIHDALPAILTGQHGVILEPHTPSTSLICPLVVVSRLILGEYPQGQGLVALALYENQETLKQALQAISPFLDASALSWGIVGVDSLKNLTEKTLVFATKENAKELNSQSELLAHVKLVFIDGLNHWVEEQSLAWLQTKISVAISTPAEESEPSSCQVVATATENTPKLREFLFLNLGEHEAFVKLPSTVNVKTPKQFAHALSAVQKFQVLLGHIKTHKPSCSVVLANTRTVAEWIAYKLQGNGVQVFLLTRPASLEQRRALVEAYGQHKATQNTGEKISVIVATDEAFQHMGIEGLQCMYQFDVPRSPQIFLARLSRIEGTARPLSITFICEDYGFYMGAIEDTLGFKVAVLKPDPKYFTIADTSDYPLETDGRVKRLDGTSTSSAPPKLRLVDQSADAAAPRPRPEARREESRRDEPRRDGPRRDEHRRDVAPHHADLGHSTSVQNPARPEPRLQPRPVMAPASAPAAAPRTPAVAASGAAPRLMPRAAAAPTGGSDANRGSDSGAGSRDKFTHRDERVKDLAQAMKQAAQNRTQPSPVEQNLSAPKPLLLPKTAHGGLSGLALALTDAMKAGVKASSEAFLEGLQAHGGSLVPAPISLAWDFFKEKMFGKSPSDDDDKPQGKSSK